MDKSLENEMKAGLTLATIGTTTSIAAVNSRYNSGIGYSPQNLNPKH